LEDLLKAQDWTDVEDARDVAKCEFIYQAKSWQHSRVLKAMRTVQEYVEVSYLGEKETVPVYQYVCYVSSYDVDAIVSYMNYTSSVLPARHGLSR